MVSVITVVFNGVHHIARTIESTLAQDYSNIECVVIDGQSTDGTQDVVRRYGSAVDVFVSEPDSSVYEAMNKAITRASGHFLLFMNCGDVFASSDAISSAMKVATYDSEQAIFGAWIRDEARGRDQATCRPDLEAGFFNHQAIVYSRTIHDWHGAYVCVPGLTTSDYLFFRTLIASERVALRCIDAPLARIDTGGISSGLQTFSQKHAIDFLCGSSGRLKLLAILAFHPAYNRIKRLLRRFV